jgi:hypothetical protein
MKTRLANNLGCAKLVIMKNYITFLFPLKNNGCVNEK